MPKRYQAAAAPCWERAQPSTTVRSETKSLLRTRFDAELTGVAICRPSDVGLPIPVCPRFELAEERQSRPVFAGEALDFEDVVGANANAVFLGFAASALDDRSDSSRFALALNYHGWLPAAHRTGRSAAAAR
jgi:hypothetical protein